MEDLDHTSSDGLNVYDLQSSHVDRLELDEIDVQRQQLAATLELVEQVRSLVASVDGLRAALPGIANSPLAKMLGLKAKG